MSKVIGGEPIADEAGYLIQDSSVSTNQPDHHSLLALSQTYVEPLSPEAERILFKKIFWRLMPLLISAFVIGYMDRQNVAFAKLQMISSLGMTEVAFGLGSSLFFVGYMLFDIPSTVAGYRYGARLWLPRIMATWGLVTVATAFAKSAYWFYALRFLLGVAEAGFYPVAIYFLASWFPLHQRVRAMGIFTLGAPLGTLLGAAIGGPMLDTTGLLGLEGWQWLFMMTGLPAIILAIPMIIWLPASPEKAWFLNAEQRTFLIGTLKREAETRNAAHGNPFAALLDWKVVGLGVIYMMASTSLYGVSYWLPTVVKSFGVTSSVNGFLNVIPWTLSILVLLIIPARLQTERAVLWCSAALALFGLSCFILSTTAQSHALRFLVISLGAPCVQMMYPCFWSIATRFFVGARAAASIAAINAIGLLGGFAAQNLMPRAASLAGNAAAAMLVPAACLAVLCLLALVGQRRLGALR